MFTNKERQVLVHLMWGATDKQIADHTGMTVVAVRVATKALMRKVKVHNRTQLATWALERSMAGKPVQPQPLTGG
jgi:two-component system nitrate/nitrite response regulator NarL